ncbi:hypothetical protein RHSIM_Rhsim13G0226800 [Rhododendron simsii]|uniref:GATA-type domain-containing protein n=1 Tax=Rhododendron simsii TaxID=118357 RepID=A0A834FZU6_RHOSS|nr:hypothetical protein RHSIM_Rhsim13G0226800 [Rhododendron simsii]
MEGSGFFRFQNRLSSSVWSYNNNNPSADQEVDLTLRLGLPDEAPTQVGLENSGILQNAGEGLERNGFSRKLNHKPWPLPVLNMLSNNWNSISVVQQQQQRKCKICQKTDTPLWRKGPDGPKVSSFIISPFLLHIYCNNNVSSLRHCANINI